MMKKKKIPFEWEEVSRNTWRAKVHGGWIVKHMSMTTDMQAGMIFVPDSIHEWEIE